MKDILIVNDRGHRTAMRGNAQGVPRLGLAAIALALVAMGPVTAQAANPPSGDPAISNTDAAASGDPWDADHREDVAFLMAAPMAMFQSHKGAQEPAGLDWSDDGCSVAGPLRYSSMFLDACERHDFGYHNYGSRLRLSPMEATRAAVDRRLKEDIGPDLHRFVCGGRPPIAGLHGGRRRLLARQGLRRPVVLRSGQRER